MEKVYAFVAINVTIPQAARHPLLRVVVDPEPSGKYQ